MLGAERIDREDSEEEAVNQLFHYGFSKVVRESSQASAYRITYPGHRLGIPYTTIRFDLSDPTGADLVITNITTLPHQYVGFGVGTTAVRRLISWAHTNNLHDIWAVQVQRRAERFWKRNGFVRDEDPNPTNDYKYEPQGAD